MDFPYSMYKNHIESHRFHRVKRVLWSLNRNRFLNMLYQHNPLTLHILHHVIYDVQ